jgi:hypothetical protein
MKAIEHKVTATDATVYTFPSGITLTAYSRKGGGFITYPKNGDVGTFTFPIRFSGDCFHALRLGLPLPDRCKAW